MCFIGDVSDFSLQKVHIADKPGNKLIGGLFVNINRCSDLLNDAVVKNQKPV